MERARAVVLNGRAGRSASEINYPVSGFARPGVDQRNARSGGGAETDDAEGPGGGVPQTAAGAAASDTVDRTHTEDASLDKSLTAIGVGPTQDQSARSGFCKIGRAADGAGDSHRGAGRLILHGERSPRRVLQSPRAGKSRRGRRDANKNH